ncbi:YgfZ/GcvT domain-containing protein [Microbacterium yannicii]|uniref:CAF17-like 4Fe-4S cluster assembly/insertion protein YgfZ n=1 Tax=Microbacterium yannicii TaxID=671622 RepID=UPI00031CB47D|nr:glycine cleavage T C-terminal barrel domain-containing protein [Microbacterium yannicii]
MDVGSAAPPFTGLPGAVLDEGGLQHLGSPLVEQRRLSAGEAIAPLGDRAIIAVAGEDRLSWLDSLSSQALTRLTPGVSTEMLVLDPQGHVEHAAAVVDDGETAWLIADRADAEGLLGWLRKMRFRLRVEPRSADDEYAVIGGAPSALDRLTPAAPAGVPLVWTDPWPDVAPGGYAYAAVDPHPGLEREWAEAIVTRDEERRIADAAAAGDIALAGLAAVDALRIAAWRPRWTSDVDERALPHELDWLRTAVHLEKGCYRGQETVAKVHNLGHPPRRLVALQLDGSDSTLPARGAAVRADGDDVGMVTSAALHYEEGPIALAIVRRSVPVDAPLTVDTGDGPIAATQEVVVPPDAGKAANVPRLTRLSRRPAAQ